jgi:hypothetical protein
VCKLAGHPETKVLWVAMLISRKLITVNTSTAKLAFDGPMAGPHDANCKIKYGVDFINDIAQKMLERLHLLPLWATGPI